MMTRISSWVKLGLRNKMPKDWDGANIFARYEKAGIELMEHDKGYMYVV